MTIGLTVLFGLLSAGMLAGRVYEILKLTDAQTGFFLYKGIVFNPYILIIFMIITVCCGVLIFANCKSEKPFFSQSSKIIAAAAGGMFIIYGAMSLKSAATAPFIIAGGLALIITAILGLKTKAGIADIAAVVLNIVFVIGLCLDVIIFNVSTVHNIEFTKNALSYIVLALFLMFVMKNVYRPSAPAKMLLFITGIAAFLFCGIMNTADIIAMAINGQAILPDLFFHAGFGFVGLFAFDNAVSVMSEKVQQAETYEQDAEDDISRPEVALYKKADADTTDVAEIKAEYVSQPESDADIQRTEMIKKLFETQTQDSDETIREKTQNKRFFVSDSSDKKTTASKEGVKVIYKKPKN